MSSVESRPDAILCRARTSAVRNAQVAEAEMAAKLATICVPDLWNNELAIVVQETKNPPMTHRYTDDLPVAGEKDEFLHEDNRLIVAH